jgi:hypothetical protein
MTEVRLAVSSDRTSVSGTAMDSLGARSCPISGHYLFPPGKLELLAGLGEAIDACGGSFKMSYVAVVVTAAKTPRL